jgi:molybdenum cofactor biosynthesis enzyme MoaA
MRLEQIGFYTLSDQRARDASASSPLSRAELILTDRCNFRCPYCRGVASPFRGDLSHDSARATVAAWIHEGLRNVRFSGGEPTLYPILGELVRRCKRAGVEHIAISTNGSMRLSMYEQLIDDGVNDFSISFDACCASTQGEMAGGVDVWNRLVSNITELSRLAYVTVGIVVTQENRAEAAETIRYADSLGVGDIRVVPSAQWNETLDLDVSREILDRNPILAYRVGNFRRGRNVRGLTESDSRRCWLAQDDVMVAGGHQFPCIIHFREVGTPIGRIKPGWREARARWVETHDAWADPVCRANCLDVCIDYNNRAAAYRQRKIAAA